MNKKNFCFQNFNYSIVIGTRNYLEYYEPYKASTHLIRKRLFKGFGVSNSYEVLQIIAQNYFTNKIKNAVKTVPKKNELEIYIENNSYRYKPKTISSFNSIIKKYCDWCENNKVNILKITPLEAQKYIAYCCMHGTSQNTAANYILVLIVLYNGLNITNVTQINPFKSVNKIRKAPVSLQAFLPKHVDAITNYCKEKNEQLFLAIKLLYTCYIRPNEQRQLQIYDINLSENYIEINGKISKNKKTQKVIIPPTLAKQLAFINNYPGHYYLFGTGGAPGVEMMGRDTISKQHKKILHELRIVGRYAFYSWKHTGVIAAVKAGINIKDLQLQLRHHSLDMVNEYLKNLGVLDSEDLRTKQPCL